MDGTKPKSKSILIFLSFYLLIMSDSTTAIAIVAVITGIGSVITLILKHIRHSECSKCCIIETRTPPDSPHIELTPPPPSPVNNHKNNIEPIYKEVEV